LSVKEDCLGGSVEERRGEERALEGKKDESVKIA
jgi:hypothetical protein